MLEAIDVMAAGAALGFGFGVYAVTLLVRNAARRRADELRATAAALDAHYDAVEAVIDDPALPTNALEMLTEFTAAIASRDFCEHFADVAVRAADQKGADPVWLAEIEALRRTRPDLVANFNLAIGTGVVALFLRWPNTARKFNLVMARIMSDTRQEARLAEKVARTRRDHDHDNGSPVSGALMPA